ncbi:MAG: proteasome accessory factor PafA2 [Acidobacteria bacterium]|nr:proteasome accessory factor PafA2 [Acidobacteriota bacterium]
MRVKPAAARSNEPRQVSTCDAALIYGIETEYGIIHRSPVDTNPITASSLLINAYLARLAASSDAPVVGWDFEDENPASDARSEYDPGAIAPQVETHLVNAVLTNGARYYVDHAHPEISTPECADPLEVLRYDRAGEMIIAASLDASSSLIGPSEELIAHKNNSDGKGNSYGCHENYLVSRATPFARIVTHAIPHFVTRQIFTGSGKIGAEAHGQVDPELPYQLTQRADFFEEQVGLETTLKRPIVNTRDEPHADPERFRRLHVIAGDANLCQVATFLKIASTAWLLNLVEADAINHEIRFADPVHAMRAVSTDLTMRQPLLLDDGRTVTALEVQWSFYEQSRVFAELYGHEVVGPSGEQALDRWEQVLHALETDPMLLNGQLDWVTKLDLIDRYRQRHDLSWNDGRLAALALQYHDMRPSRSIFARLETEKLVADEDAFAAMTKPPEDTRAYFRGECLSRWPDQIVAANWDSIVFQVGADALQRVPMMDPYRGTRALIGEVLDASSDPASLLANLSR